MTSILIAIGLVPFFTGRTLFTTGVVVSISIALNVTGTTELTFTSAFIVLLGVAVSFALEVGFTKLKPWLRDALTSALTLPKALQDIFSVGAALLCAGALIDGTSRVEMIAACAGVAALAWVFSRLRSNADEIFETLPVAQLPGVSTTLLGVELLGTLAGVALVFLAPVVGVVLMVLALIGLALLAFMLRRFRDGAREVCTACGASVHACAVSCAKCGAAHHTHRVGWLGRPAKTFVDDETRHRLVLLAGHRCPRCAEGLSGSACTTCGTAFRDDTEFDAFIRHVDTRFAVLTPVIIGLGFVPVLGLAIALVTYKLSAAGALAGYADWRGRIGVRFLRLVMLVGLALVQPVPLIGVGATWAYLTLSHVWLRSTVRAQRAGAAKALAHA